MPTAAQEWAIGIDGSAHVPTAHKGRVPPQGTGPPTRDGSADKGLDWSAHKGLVRRPLPNVKARNTSLRAQVRLTPAISASPLISVTFRCLPTPSPINWCGGPHPYSLRSIRCRTLISRLCIMQRLVPLPRSWPGRYFTLESVLHPNTFSYLVLAYSSWLCSPD
jgi:hypothetical protein